MCSCDLLLSVYLVIVVCRLSTDGFHPPLQMGSNVPPQSQSSDLEARLHTLSTTQSHRLFPTTPTTMSREFQKQAAKISLDLDRLDDLIEERARLVESLHLTPSAADNLDLLDVLGRVKAALQLLQEDGGSLSQTTTLVNRYRLVIAPLDTDPYILVAEYRVAETTAEPSKKSVRFKDNVDGVQEDVDAAQLRSQLMGTAAFRPYRDDDSDDDRNTLLSVTTTNHELFALHQQQLVAQDDSLDQLHQLVRAQHSMGLTINDELDEQIVILNDLESGVDMSASRLARATTNLRSFRRRVRENGSLVTIVVLTVILVLLLVVLN